MFCGQGAIWWLLGTACAFSQQPFFLTTRSDVARCRYGSSANLVLSIGKGVNGYTLDAALGEFILTHPDVCLSTAPHKAGALTHVSDNDPAPRQDLLDQ
jgi:fructose-1,6-bisphosphatase